MKRIELLSGPYDFGLYDLEHGYLISENHAIYVDGDEGNIWLIRGIWEGTPPVFKQDSGSIRMGQITEDDGVIILKIVDMLRGMSGLDFMIRFLVDGDTHIEFDLVQEFPPE
jgi:hypothetical protein